MALATAAELIDSLRSLHLLEPAQLEEASRIRASDPQTLAKELHRRGWMTPFQVQSLFKGQGSNLLLGSYVLLDRIGAGGMGEVFKARNWKLGRIVALKVIRQDKLQSPETVRRFQREVKMVASLSHPNIVKAFDADQLGGSHILAMELVEGFDLQRRVKQSGPLPPAEACDCVRQAALGLQHAHERGLVHRDIKPSNLLVAKGVVKILDLGLARIAESGGEDDTASELTKEGSVLGTVDYLAPEQALNSRNVDIRADLYSLGCTLYFLLTGQVPFPGGAATEKLLKHRLEEPTPVEQLRREVPAGLAAVVRKLMAKMPEDRYQTPAELAATLAGGLGGLKSAPALKPAAPIRDPLRPGFRQKLKWMAAGAGALILCIFILGVIKHGEGDGKVPARTPTVAVKPPLRYHKRATREQTILATLKENGFPNLEGKWHVIGYFDFNWGKEKAYPPEQEIDLTKSYPGKLGRLVSWREFPGFQPGQEMNLQLYPQPWGSCLYLYHEIEAAEALDLPVALGCDDTLTLWLNGEKLANYPSARKANPLIADATLKLRPGKNQLLLKVCNLWLEYYVSILPLLPTQMERAFGDSLKRDFPSADAAQDASL